MQIKFLIGKLQIPAEITEKNKRISEAILNSLPLSGKANIWGEEVYFGVPLKLEDENAKKEVEIGDVAYWKEGNAICIFFGRTPISKGSKPIAYSPVNVFAKIVGDAKIFKNVKAGDIIEIK